MAAIAGSLAMVLLGVACEANSIGARPAAGDSASASPRQVDFSDCTLPVVGANTYITVPGFIDTGTGPFKLARVVPTDPVTSPHNPSTYVPELRRWLPIWTHQVSPDGRSYAYLKAGAASQELHIRDLASGRDAVIQTFDPTFYLETWGTTGIRLGAANNGWQHWLVDPGSGATVFYPAHAPYPWISQPGDPTGPGYSTVGYTFSGDPVWWVSLRGGSGAWLFYDTPEGQRVYVYRGAPADTPAFYPGNILADQTGLWFGNGIDRSVVWHRSPPAGMKRIVVSGLPAAFASLSLFIAGPCF